MYTSKRQIDKKMRQVRYLLNDINKYRCRVIENSGIDPATGAHPLVIHVSSLLAQGRSIIQYAFKEAKEVNRLDKYEEYVHGSKIIAFFRDLRDVDVHENTIGVHTIISGVSYLSPSPDKENCLVSDKLRVTVEKFSDMDNPKQSERDYDVVYRLSKKVEITESVKNELRKRDRKDLLESIEKGNEIYNLLEFEGNDDLHELCDMYVKELKSFVDYGEQRGFIS